MVYRGSPEEWDWDGSFGSETNPKPGGEQSKWIKENAQSGGGRNEEYYGKIWTVTSDIYYRYLKFENENGSLSLSFMELFGKAKKT